MKNIRVLYVLLARTHATFLLRVPRGTRIDAARWPFMGFENAGLRKFFAEDLAGASAPHENLHQRHRIRRLPSSAATAQAL